MTKQGVWAVRGLNRGFALCGMAGLLLASACDNGPSAVETRDRAAEPAAVAEALPETTTHAPTDAGAASYPGEAGKARWTANRRHSAEENIQRLYARNGATFGARSADDYVVRAHAFISNPPPGTETARRSNGDTLYYQAASNTFAVADRNGTPRTMFKPDDGEAYWEQQKARLASASGRGG